MRLFSCLILCGLLRMGESTARDMVEIRLLRLLANNPFIPFETVVQSMGSDVDAGLLAHVHSRLMSIAAVPQGAVITVPGDSALDVHSYIKRGPLHIPRPDLLRNYFLSESDVLASRHGLVLLAGSTIEHPRQSVLPLPNGWDNPSKAGIFLTMTPEIFVLHALSQDMYATDSAIENLAQRAVFFPVSVEEIKEVREHELAATVLPAETVRILEDLYHSGIRATTSPSFLAALPTELQEFETFCILKAWMRLMIVPALRSGLRSITSPHEPYVVMPEATAKQFFLSRLHSITGNINSLNLVTEDDRRNAFSVVIWKMAESTPQPSDSAIIALVDSFELGLSATDVTVIIERFEEITVIPTAVIERMRIYQPDSEMAALFPEGSRMRNLRVLNSIIPIWRVVCLDRGLCVDRGQVWELTPEGARDAYIAALPREAEPQAEVAPATEAATTVDPEPSASSTDASATQKPLKRTRLD